MHTASNTGTNVGIPVKQNDFHKKYKNFTKSDNKNLILYKRADNKLSLCCCLNWNSIIYYITNSSEQVPLMALNFLPPVVNIENVSSYLGKVLFRNIAKFLQTFCVWTPVTGSAKCSQRVSSWQIRDSTVRSPHVRNNPAAWKDPLLDKG